MSVVTLDEVSALALQLSPLEQAQLMEHLAAALRDMLSNNTPKRQDWLQFIEETAGSLANDPIERGDQGTLEIRDEILTALML